MYRRRRTGSRGTIAHDDMAGFFSGMVAGAITGVLPTEVNTDDLRASGRLGSGLSRLWVVAPPIVSTLGCFASGRHVSKPIHLQAVALPRRGRARWSWRCPARSCRCIKVLQTCHWVSMSSWVILPSASSVGRRRRCIVRHRPSHETSVGVGLCGWPLWVVASSRRK